MDPFLLTYQVGKESLLYDISSGIQPLSIRDQMFRGHMVIQRALSEGLIKAEQEQPVLIIGAGIAGAIAALTALENKVPTVLVEANIPFVRQLHARSRFICPTQYDWPAPHWQMGKYPWAGRALPLEWKSNSASAVVLAWSSRLKLEQLNNAKWLKVKSRTKFVRHAVVPGEQALDAYLETANGEEQLRCSMIVSCAGLGVERHWVPDQNPNYVGYGFWELDEFEKPDLGLGGIRPNVLISGSGDGALQDFLRITTGHKSVGLIYNKAIARVLDEEHRLAIERDIQVAEDYAQRSYVWGRIGELDHPIQQRLQDDHQKVIDKIHADSKLWKKVEKALDNFVGNLNKRLNISLVYPCEHFSTCYPMNRFLVLLVAQYIRTKFEYEPLKPRVKVLDILGYGNHHCSLKPPSCHGENHEVLHAAATCATFNAAGTDQNDRSLIEGGPYNVVIIRHGIKGNAPPLGATSAAAPPRQIIPYYIPWLP